MAQIIWTGGNGSWGDGADWSGGVPTSADSVTIATPGITVSIGQGVAAAAYTLTVLGSNIDLDGGSLYTVAGGNFQGGFTESAGTYSMTGVGAVFDGALSQTGGTMDVITGAITINDGAILSGTISGYGTLDINQGTTYLDAGFACTVNTFLVGGNGLLGININFSTAHNFTEQAGGTVDLFGHTLTVSGYTQIDGVIGNGTVIQSGTSTLGYGPGFTTVIDNGLIFEIKGVVTQEGNIALGTSDSGGKIEVLKAGQYDINSNWTILDPSSIGSITNAGLFAKTGGGKTATIDPSFTNTGSLNVAIGTLELNGLVNSLSGKISGTGTLAIAGGQTTLSKTVSLNVAGILQQSGVLVLNSALGYAGEWDQTGGVLNLNGHKADLTLTGQTDLSGGTLSGYGGTLTLNGPAQFGDDTIGGPNTIDINGALHQTNSMTFGLSSNPVANIAAGAAWLMEGNGSNGDNNIYGAYGVIKNSGTFGIVNASGTSIVDCQVINTGTLTAGNGVLVLAGVDSIGGTVTGNGELVLGGSIELDSGVSLGVSSLNVGAASPVAVVYTAASLTYAHEFSQTAGNLELGGNTMTLTGASTFDGGQLLDGVLAVNGTAVVFEYIVQAGGDFSIGGKVEQAGPGSVLTDNGEVSIGAMASYTLDDDVSIAGSGAVIDAGTLTAAATGTSTISTMLDLTGTLALNNQAVVLTGGATLAGIVNGTGTLILDDNSPSDSYVMAAGLSLASGAVLLNGANETLAANFSYAGSLTQIGSSVVQLEGYTETLSGTSTLAGGTVEGSGTLAISGAGTLANIIVVNGAVLSVTGTAEQIGVVQIGSGNSGSKPADATTMSIAKGATDTLEANASINGNGTLSVTGTLIAAANSSVLLGPTIVDAGTIAANLGTLSVLSAVSGAGVFSIGTAGVLDFSTGSTITASNTISFTAGGGELKLDNLQTFNASLANFATHDDIVLTQIDPGSITVTYGATHDQLVVTDSHGGSITLDFTAAQTLSSITTGTVGGLAALIHN